MAKKRVVVIGGGTGSYTVLTGLKSYPLDLTAVVAMTDNGGSSGRLRDEFGHLPPGDVRQCLVALAPEDRAGLLLRQLFNYRFNKGDGLSGHSFGNLFITALTEITGGIDRAIAEAGRLLGIHGQVLPVTLTKAQLCARLRDNTLIVGEENIDVREEKPDVPIDYVFLEPKAFVNQKVVEAIEQADLVVIGPGDLYTSVLPNFLVDGIPQAIATSRAIKIYVCNLMTKRGESDGFKASNFISEILEYLGSPSALDWVILNEGPVPERTRARYRGEGAELVEADVEECQKLVPHVVVRHLATVGTFLRHDPVKLSQAVMKILAAVTEAGEKTIQGALKNEKAA